MNINPSDTDVGQGFALAASANAVKAGTMAQSVAETQSRSGQTSTQQPGSSQTDEVDERSLSAAAIADRTTAKETAQKLGEQLQANGTGLKIRVLDDSRSSVQVEVVDEKSNKVLRKIPQDEILKLSASINEMTGVLLNNPA